MNVFKPEVAELLALVEKKYAKKLSTTTDFEELSLHLKLQHELTVSASTLKRMWGYVNDAHKPRVNTLDALSRYIGFDNYSEFCRWLKSSSAYNSSFFTAKQLSATDLQEGGKVEIGWAPNRYVKLVYCGNALFEVVEVLHSKLQVGDRFEVASFLLGQPLSLPYIIRDGMRTSPFIAGRNGGLTLLNCL